MRQFPNGPIERQRHKKSHNMAQNYKHLITKLLTIAMKEFQVNCHGGYLLLGQFNYNVYGTFKPMEAEANQDLIASIL